MRLLVQRPVMMTIMMSDDDDADDADVDADADDADDDDDEEETRAELFKVRLS